MKTFLKILYHFNFSEHLRMLIDDNDESTYVSNDPWFNYVPKNRLILFGAAKTEDQEDHDSSAILVSDKQILYFNSIEDILGFKAILSLRDLIKIIK